MRKLALILPVTLLTATMAAGAQAKTYKVKELNNGKQGAMTFQPDYLKVKPGDTVEFVPTDTGHTSRSVEVPKGAKTWDSGISQDIKVTLKTPGIYIYDCKPHHTLGMAGVIQVGKAGNIAQAEQAAKKLEGEFVMNQGRLKSELAKVH